MVASRGSWSCGAVLTHGLGFGGALLEKEDGQDHVHGHLQELGFPVLERGFHKIARGQILQHGDARLPVGRLILAVGRRAGEDHSAEKRQEQSGVREQQPMFLGPLAHVCSFV